MQGRSDLLARLMVADPDRAARISVTLASSRQLELEDINIDEGAGSPFVD